MYSHFTSAPVVGKVCRRLEISQVFGPVLVAGMIGAAEPSSQKTAKETTSPSTTFPAVILISAPNPAPGNPASSRLAHKTPGLTLTAPPVIPAPPTPKQP